MCVRLIYGLSSLHKLISQYVNARNKFAVMRPECSFMPPPYYLTLLFLCHIISYYMQNFKSDYATGISPVA